MSTKQQVVSILTLPTAVTIIVPSILLVLSNMSFLGLWFQNPFSLVLISIGILTSAIGFTLLAFTIRLFAVRGHGTLAPWAPPSELVATGIYGHVRNPMIAGVLLILLGESLLFESWPLFLWFFFCGILNHFYFIFSEEPGLIKRFGDDYLLYMENVPRWIPRKSPWIFQAIHDDEIEEE